MSRLHEVRWPVTTERLVLRLATPEDGDALYAIRSRPEVAEWVTSMWTDRDDFQTGYVDTDRFAKVVAVELAGGDGNDRVGDSAGRLIGELMISIEDGWAQREVAADAAGVQAELGWVIAPAHSGRGYATEAVAAAITLCFAQLGLRRVVAYCYSDNVASWRLMERLGMRRETVSVRDSLHRTRGWLDGYGYAVLADEWPA